MALFTTDRIKYVREFVDDESTTNEVLHRVAAKLDQSDPDDVVTRPKHYTRWAIEPVEFLMRNGVEGHLFSIVKYAMRAGYKLYPNQDARQSEITDLRKAIRFAEMRINLLNNEAQL